MNDTKNSNGKVTSNGDNIILFDPNSSPGNKLLYDYAVTQPIEPGVIKLFSHGNWSSIDGQYFSPNEISAMLKDHSPTWKSYIDGGKKNNNIRLEIHACSVASNSTAIAYKFSRSFPNITISAPTNIIQVNRSTTYKDNFWGRTFEGVKYNSKIINGGKWIHIKNGSSSFPIKYN